MTPDRLLRWLLSFPFPGAVSAMQGDELTITLEGEVLRFDGAWRAPDGQRIACTLPDVSSADDIHAEIRRGLAIARGITGASWHNVEPKPAPNGALVYRLLSAHPYPVASDLRLSLDGVCRFGLDGVTWCFRDDGWHVLADTFAHHLPAADHVTAKLLHAEIGRVRALIDGTPSWEQTKEDCVGPDLPGDDALQDRLTDEIDRRRDMEQALAKMTDAHAVVSQRLAGSQKEVTEVSAERDTAQARAGKVEDRLRRDDELREQIAAAVGLDGSASLALIFDTVNRDRPAREIARLSGLLDVLAAPVTFGERRLSTAERAEWALRRALRERDEVAPRMAQLIDAEVCLDVLGVPAYAAVPGDDPGDASEALTVAERLRLYFGAQS